MASEEGLSPREETVIFKLGRLRAEGKRRKHSGGYRYYELTDVSITEFEVSSVHASLASKEMVFWNEITKHWDNGRIEDVYLIDLTHLGLVTFFRAKAATRSGLVPLELRFLDSLLDDGEILLRDLSARVLLSYIDFVDMSDKTGYNISDFAKKVLNEEDKDRALMLFDGLKEAAERAPRQKMTNSEVDLFYSAVDLVEKELKDVAPRKNILVAKLLLLLTIAAAVAAVVSAILDLLQFLG
jgi:hypothetical protein